MHRPSSGQVMILGHILQLESLPLLLAHATDHCVKDVIIPLALILIHDSGLFQQILLDLGPLDHAVLVKVDVNVLAEARGVVVPHRFRISKGLQDRIRLDHLLFDPRVLSTDRRHVLQYQFGAFCLPRSRFATDDHTLIPLLVQHLTIRVVADRKDMRRLFADPLHAIPLDLTVRVDRQDLIGIDRHQHAANVGLEGGRERKGIVDIIYLFIINCPLNQLNNGKQLNQ